MKSLMLLVLGILVFGSISGFAKSGGNYNCNILIHRDSAEVMTLNLKVVSQVVGAMGPSIELKVLGQSWLNLRFKAPNRDSADQLVSRLLNAGLISDARVKLVLCSPGLFVDPRLA